MSEAFIAWWQEHYDMAHLAMGAASDAWDAATIAERERCVGVAERAASRADAFVAERLEGPSIDFQRYAEGARDVARLILVHRS